MRAKHQPQKNFLEFQRAEKIFWNFKGPKKFSGISKGPNQKKFSGGNPSAERPQAKKNFRKRACRWGAYLRPVGPWPSANP
jgi:hypothetical protein